MAQEMSHAAVLIVGGGILPSYLVKEAQAMDLYTIVTGTSADAPACALADEHYLLDPLDGDGHAKLAAGLRDAHACQLKGVCCAGADNAPTVARAAAAAGLPGIPVEVAALTHNKGAVREALDAAGLGLYQPEYLRVAGDQATAFRAQAITERYILGGWPVVVKPLTQRASRGVSLVQTPEALAEAVAKVLPYGDEYLLEQGLVGTEHSAEAIFGEDGRVEWFNVVDRMFSYEGGLAIETGHVNPTCLSERAQQQILLMVLSAARALGVQWGAFKLDVMMTAEGPKILEATARLSGGFDAQGTSPLTGRHPMRQLLQLSCGLPVEPQTSAEGYAACAAILPWHTGVVTALPRIQRVVGVEGLIWDTVWTIQPGDLLHPATHNGERVGFVLAPGATYDTAWNTAQSAALTLAQQIEVTDEQCPVDDPPAGTL